ncbi:DUF4124 domain-containing protein [Alcanivorax sp. JB21]|uniref:DUF4124 domain-containing protein n=1 Tax=Alcanivorax limicola TaxID=2874102 RepID=UPI001CBB0F16|nr:DUF4124 domain-containing protein [Alcanivorax limicola]MBZ2190160.1 DUF4124 domain-containing protein [Alcanivorax limicola]
MKDHIMRLLMSGSAVGCLLLALAVQPGLAVGADAADDSDEFAETPQSGQVYRYVDAEGNVLFTDQRPEGAEPVTVPQGNQFEGREAAQRARSATSRRSDARGAAEPRPQNGTVSGADRHRQAQEQLKERVAACERSNVADCSPATVMRRLEEERYRQTPEGRQQQQAIGNRLNR